MSSVSKFPFKTAFGLHVPCDTDIDQDDVHTIQSMKDECDINIILSKFSKSGIIEHLAATEGSYDDFLSAADYHSAMNHIIAAQEAFGTLSAPIRNRFENDPAKFLEFVQDPNNYDEMVNLGLANPRSSSAEIVIKNSEPLAQNVVKKVSEGDTTSGAT